MGERNGDPNVGRSDKQTGAEARDEVTRLLGALEAGDERAAGRLLPLIYDELKALARAQRRCVGRSETLNTTGLVHEAYLRLASLDDRGGRSRAQFFALAGKAMRSVIVDHARRRNAEKRGGGRRRVALDDAVDAVESQGIDVLALHDALDELARIDERKARLVELRFFAGLEVREAAEALGVSEPTAKRDWRAAKAWLRELMETGSINGDASGGDERP